MFEARFDVPTQERINDPIDQSVKKYVPSTFFFQYRLLEPFLIATYFYLLGYLLDGYFQGVHVVLSLITWVLAAIIRSAFDHSFRSHAGNGAKFVNELSYWVSLSSALFIILYTTDYLAQYSSFTILVWFVTTPLVLFVSRQGLVHLYRRLSNTSRYTRSAVIVGMTDTGMRLTETLTKDPALLISFKGYFDDRSSHRLSCPDELVRLGQISDVVSYVSAHRIHIVYIMLPMVSQPRVLELLYGLKDTVASVYFVPNILAFEPIQARVDLLNGIPVLAVNETPFFGIYAVLKRAIDIIIATAILIVVSPLMLTIAVLIKMTSTGPVLFRQRRYGVNGEEFLIYKFRSMIVCEDGEMIQQAKKNDNRVTSLGRFLRRTSLDELPQFINVLQGHMSIVGPRPHAVAHNELYRKLIEGYMLRHKVKPGITGWAQVNGCRGETETLEKMISRKEYDLHYVRNWSLWLDFVIIWRTIITIWRDQKAY